MPPVPAYTRNRELFGRFHALQRSFVGRLAANPRLIRAWLQARPAPAAGEAAAEGAGSRSWRAARLSLVRRRHLVDLLARAEPPAGDSAPLAAWLLAAVPVCTYLEMAENARPCLAMVDPEADRFRREVIVLRETLLLANYGLALTAARRRRYPDYDDRLSAAACGLLDAIDRYVPNERAARFGYFASYWIRYHLSRQAQKSGSLVSFPIYQQRVGRRISRYVSERCAAGGPPPSEAEICSELGLGLDACYWHRRRPEMVSLQAPAGADPDSATIERFLSDPAPGPAEALEETETAACLHALIRAHAPPATRLMLAYTRGVGRLREAAEDYLADLHEEIRGRFLRRAPPALRP
jgi:DNA-directed RNA polymerase specialized sigma subunit